MAFYKNVEFSKLYKELYNDYYMVNWDGKEWKRVYLTTSVVQGTVSLGPETNELGEVAP